MMCGYIRVRHDGAARLKLLDRRVGVSWEQEDIPVPISHGGSADRKTVSGCVRTGNEDGMSSDDKSSGKVGGGGVGGE